MRSLPRPLRRPAVRAAAAGLLLLASHPAPALTLRLDQKTCPYDGQKVEAMVPASGTSFGKDFDFRPVGPVMTPYL